jgi:serine/threonine protein kinase
MTDPLIGKEMGGCKILKKLGEGGMGWAYQAHHTRLDRDVVLKILLPDLAKDPEQAQAFLREAQAAARMEHPRIVQVYDQGSAEGMHYIIMQFVDGETLEDMMQREGAMPAIKALAIIKAALEGLREAHKHGIVHRDVKPSNIFMSKDGAIRLADFGLALKMQKGKASDTRVIGTPLYMSPEQIWGGEMDGRSDIYSMGATLYHMLAGVPPYEAPSPTDIVSMHVNNPAPDIRRTNSDISKALAELILGMMAKKADARPSTVDEVLNELASPAMVLETASVEGEQMIDLGPEVGERRRTMPGRDMTPPLGPPTEPPPTAPGDVHGGHRPITEPRILSDSKLTPWRPFLGALLWLVAGTLPYAAGLHGQWAFLAGAILIGASAAFVSPKSLNGPLVPIALSGLLGYLAGTQGASFLSAFRSNDPTMLYGSLGVLFTAWALGLTWLLYRGPLLRVIYLLVAAGAAAMLFKFALPAGSGFEILQSAAHRHPHALFYLGGSFLMFLLGLFVCGTRPHAILGTVFVTAGSFCAYAAGAVHHQTIAAPTGIIARAQKAKSNQQKQQRDVMVVIENGQTVVKKSPQETRQPAPTSDLKERPNLHAALKQPLAGIDSRLKASGALAPLALGLLLMGVLAAWREARPL